METLTKDNIMNFTRFGLIAICSTNRDVCSGYNLLNIRDLRNYLLGLIERNISININPSILSSKYNLYKKNCYKK